MYLHVAGESKSPCRWERWFTPVLLTLGLCAAAGCSATHHTAGALAPAASPISAQRRDGLDAATIDAWTHRLTTPIASSAMLDCPEALINVRTSYALFYLDAQGAQPHANEDTAALRQWLSELLANYCEYKDAVASGAISCAHDADSLNAIQDYAALADPLDRQLMALLEYVRTRIK